MNRIFALILVAAAVALCAGKTYTITLYGPATVGATELKAGDHKVTVVDQNTVIIDGKAESKTAVKVETGSEKYGSTSVRLSSSDGKPHVEAIRIGGTNTRIVIAEPATNAGN